MTTARKPARFVLPQLMLLAVLAGATLAVSPTDASHVEDRTYVFRNLAFGNERFLHYFAVDPDTGVMRLDPKVTQNMSGGLWEVQRAWDNYRSGYRTYYIRNRSNSPYNGYYLNLHPATKTLVLTKTPSSNDYAAYWSIRYAKHEHGRAHFMIQSLGHSGRDMAFLTADPETGIATLEDKLSPSGMWTMNRVPLPPSGRIW